MDGFAPIADTIFPVNSSGWTVRRYGPGLICCTKITDPTQEPGIVAAIDLGSRSVKQLIADRSESSLTTLTLNGTACGLGSEMTFGNPVARLSQDGITKLFDDALPKFVRKQQQFVPDTIIVGCTEAVRAAYMHDTKAVIKFCKRVAEALGIPVAAINILGEDVETDLGVEATLFGRPNAHGKLIMGGGNSVEVADIIHGEPIKDRRKTLHIGSQILTKLDNPGSVIEEQLNAIQWMLAADAVASRKDELNLVGGWFRGAGRLLAQRMLRISPVSEMPFDGISFANNKQLRQHLKAFEHIDNEELIDEFLRSTIFSPTGFSNGDLKHWKKSKTGQAFLESDPFEKWQKRIEARAPTMPLAAQFILTALDRTQAHKVFFIRHGSREAMVARFDPALWAQSLGKKIDITLPSVQTLPPLTLETIGKISARKDHLVAAYK